MTETEKFIILNKGDIFHRQYFDSFDAAVNYLKMQFPKRKFKVEEGHVFTDTYFGRKFNILSIFKH